MVANGTLYGHWQLVLYLLEWWHTMVHGISIGNCWWYLYRNSVSLYGIWYVYYSDP